MSDNFSTVNGFVETIKNKGKIAFVTINTQQGFKQLVLSGEVKEQLNNITPGSYVRVTGEEVENANIKDERFDKREIQVSAIIVDTKADILPVLKTLPILTGAKDFRTLQLRQPEYRLIMEANHISQMAMRQYRDAE